LTAAKRISAGADSAAVHSRSRILKTSLDPILQRNQFFAAIPALSDSRRRFTEY
jgi:hypothetical protein